MLLAGLVLVVGLCYLVPTKGGQNCPPAKAAAAVTLPSADDPAVWTASANPTGPVACQPHVKVVWRVWSFQEIRIGQWKVNVPVKYQRDEQWIPWDPNRPADQPHQTWLAPDWKPK